MSQVIHTDHRTGSRSEHRTGSRKEKTPVLPVVAEKKPEVIKNDTTSLFKRIINL